jgi:hypothetical protein
MTMLIENNVLTVDGHTEELPRLATPGVVRVWKVPTEYRESGYFVSVQAAGKPMELPACAANEMQFVGEAELAPADDAALDQVKKEKLSQVLAASDAAMAALSSRYSEHEKLSWPKQEQEAKALQADPEAPAPLLRGVAATRGIALEALQAKVLANVGASEAATAFILGTQQKYEDEIAAAATIEEVQLVVPIFEMPE